MSETRQAEGQLKPITQWLANGDRGISSNAIVHHLTGVPCVRYGKPGNDHPHDPDDLTRCVKLLERCPELAPRVGEMATRSPEWAALAGQWDELVEMLDFEVPGWRNGRHGTASATYKRMRELIDGARTS